MASTDAKPIPQKNVAYRVTFPILDADGDLVTGATGLDSEISKDGGTFADCTNEATEIATASGMYFLDLTSTEMNADTVAIIVKTSSAGAKTTPIVMYPEEAGDIRVNATQWNSLTTVALPLIPTTAGRTLDVSATGEAGLDWANIGSPTTAQNLSATNIDVDQVVASVSGAVGSVTAGVTVTTNNDKTGYGLSSAAVQGIWDALTSALTTANSIGKKLADWVIGTTQTGDSFARLGAPTGASVSADIAAVKAQTAAIEVDTQDIQSRLPAALGANGNIKADVRDWIGAAVAAPTVAGVPEVDVTHFGGGTDGAGGLQTMGEGYLADGYSAARVVDMAANVVTAAAIAAGAIDRDALAADTGLQSIRSNTAQAGAATTITLDASASAVDSFYNNALILLTGGTGAGQARFISAYVGATKVATVATWATNPDVTTTFSILPFDAVAGASAPTAAQVATAVWQDLLAGSDFSTASSIGKLLKDDIDAAISSRMATYAQPTGFLAATFPAGTVANTTNITAGTITTATNLTTNNDKTGYGLSAAAVQAIWDALTSALTTVGSIGKKLADWVIGTSQTGDSFARLGAPAGASVSADILAIDNLVDDLESRIGTPSDLGGGATVAANLADIESQTDDIGFGGAGLNAIPWNIAWDSEVQSEVDDALIARSLNLLVLASGVADSGSTTTMVDAARTEADNDYWKGRVIQFTSGNIAGQCAFITDFNAATDTFTLAPPLTQAVATQSYIILPSVSAWDDVLAEHLTSGSTGASLNAAGGAGDPWITALPGAYGAGTAGKIVGDNINATIGSRASQTSVDDIPTNAELATALGTADDAILAAIAALNNLSQANIRTAIGLATANLDTQLGDLPTNAELATALGTADDAVLAAIAALNNLSQANIRTAVGLASANLDTQLTAIDDFLDTEVAAIKTKTDQFVFTVANQVDANALSGGGSGLDAAGVRAAVGLASANLDTQLDALPTNAELATALAAADDAVLAAIAALNNLSQANIRTAVGLASANLDTQLDALPTNAELATALGTADDAVLAAVSALSALATAIKAKTDSLVFTVANQVDSNIQSVNDVTVTGTGASGDEWGP